MEFKFDFFETESTTTEQILLTPGPAKFKVKAAYTTDKNGNQLKTLNGEPKLKVDLFVTDSENKSTICYEHITAKNGWRLGKLLKAIGKGDLYNKEGRIDTRQLLGGTGDCVVKTSPARDKYAASTVVEEYIAAEQTAPVEDLPPLDTYVDHANASFPEEDPNDQDLPF